MLILNPNLTFDYLPCLTNVYSLKSLKIDFLSLTLRFEFF
ncbi:hypothetical protein FHS10_004124 [Mucilaginibacter dorajii]|nr:hypothetical protein [Mucilaginibacter dorajii]